MKIELQIEKKHFKFSCNVAMPSEDIKILETNQNQNYDKALSYVYADLKWLKVVCKNNPKISFTTKISEHIRSIFFMPAIY